MRNLLRCTIASCFLSSALPLLAQTPPPPPPAPTNQHWRDEKAILSGTVTDETGAKLKNATISFTGRFTGTRVYTKTNHLGQYKVSLQLGIYTVEVDARHLMPMTTEVTLSENTSKDLVVGTTADAGAPTPH